MSKEQDAPDILSVNAACKKMLDNGWRVVLYRNSLGTYTARASRVKRKAIETDGTEPSDAIIALSEKLIGNI